MAASVNIVLVSESSSPANVGGVIAMPSAPPVAEVHCVKTVISACWTPIVTIRK